MYTNSKDQKSLENFYRLVHLDEKKKVKKEKPCECGEHDEKECSCNETEKVDEAIDMGTISHAAHTLGHGYKDILNTVLHDHSFYERVLKYWIWPGIAAAAVILANKGFDLISKAVKSKIDSATEQEKKKITEDLLKSDNVLMVLDKLQKMDKDHQHNTPQYVHLQRELASEIEKHLEKNPSLFVSKMPSGGVWSTYRKRKTSFDVE